MLKGLQVPKDFYPFVDNGTCADDPEPQVRHPARIAVYDDAAAAPRVVVVEPKDVRAYLEEITLQVTQLAKDQGGSIPFMVVREIVENLIHAYFMEPTVSILDHGNTIRFSDQGPGIAEKERALQYGTTSATEEMRRYIRGVGSGLPYVQQYMLDKGGSLTIEDNISGGTVVTLTVAGPSEQEPPQRQPNAAAAGQDPGAAVGQWVSPATIGTQQGYYQTPARAYPLMQQGSYPYPTPGYPTQPYPQPIYQQQAPFPQAPPITGQQQQPPSMPQVSVRGQAVLDYLRTHGSVGPTELVGSYGESLPTWSRELQALEGQGLVRKDGQKRRLTAAGAAYLGM